LARRGVILIGINHVGTSAMAAAIELWQIAH
jgi:hypothetical protein